MQLVEDLDAFLRDFGELAYWRAGPQSWTVDGTTFTFDSTTVLMDGAATASGMVILDQPDSEILGGRVMSREYRMTHPAALFPGIGNGDQVVINGVTYAVLTAQLVADGAFAEVALERP